MRQTKPGRPTLESFARLVENARGEADYRDTILTLEWLIRGNSEAAQLNRELEAAVEDCDTAEMEGARVEAATAARQFETLIAHPAEWQDPGEVLEEEEPCYESLVRICEARLAENPEKSVLMEAYKKLRLSLGSWQNRQQTRADQQKAEAELTDRILERIKRELAQQCPFLRR